MNYTNITSKFKNIYSSILLSIKPESNEKIQQSKLDINQDDLLFQEIQSIYKKKSIKYPLIGSAIFSSIITYSYSFLNNNLTDFGNLFVVSALFSYLFFDYLKKCKINKEIFKRESRINLSKCTITELINFIVPQLDVSEEEQTKIKDHILTALNDKNYLTNKLFLVISRDGNYYNINNPIDLSKENFSYHFFVLISKLLKLYEEGTIFIPQQKIQNNFNYKLDKESQDFSVDIRTCSNFELWDILITNKKSFNSLIENKTLKNYLSISDINFINSNYNKLIQYEKNFLNSNNQEIKSSLQTLIKNNIIELNSIININIDNLNSHLIKEMKIDNKILNQVS